MLPKHTRGVALPAERDALAAKSDKFLSEFVGFRESAHLWCLLHPGGYAGATVAVPGWARGMLRRTSRTSSAMLTMSSKPMNA